MLSADHPGRRTMSGRRLGGRDKVLFGLVGLIALLMAGSFTLAEARAIEVNDAAVVNLRATLLTSNVNAYARTVEGMAASVQRWTESQLPQDDLRFLRNYPEHKVYALSGVAADGGQESRIGTLTGIGDARSLTPALRREITAALNLDGQFEAHLSRDSEAVWVYYTSASNFMYLAPKVPVADFQMNADQYDNAFWTEAIPSANPRHDTVVTDLYEDGAGKGLMITVSHPVMDGERLLGVASADIGISTLRTMLGAGEAAGTSQLVGRNGNLIARIGPLHPGEHVGPELASLSEGVHRIGSRWWTVHPLLDGRVVLLHELELSTLVERALRSTAHVWGLMVALVGTFYLMLLLRRTLASVTVITRTDPLTGVLNRRGFVEDVEPTSHLADRTSLQQSLALIDLDHFKQINDRFGHHEGDRVLAAVAAVMVDSIRTSDRLCRWGGEEFAIMLPGTDLDGAVLLLDRLRQKVTASVELSDGTPVTFSAGVVNAPGGVELDRVIGAADQLLYEAKQAGRDRVHGKQVHFEVRPTSATPSEALPGGE
ncbi:MAG: diguanylate cyclase [Kineosporiaceae bacterium]|nr:diguanylate cyclase [Kineosporiaceae bacterium]MBK7623312.1 diguanylate cyclase [Kineosporiaceae bacterium]